MIQLRDLQFGRQAETEFDHAPIQERTAVFDPEGASHPIAHLEEAWHDELEIGETHRINGVFEHFEIRPQAFASKFNVSVSSRNFSKTLQVCRIVLAEDVLIRGVAFLQFPFPGDREIPDVPSEYFIGPFAG